MFVLIVIAIILGSDPVQSQPAYDCTAGMSAFEPHDSCDSFWECNNGVWLEQICPAGSFWNNANQECAEDVNGNCGPSSGNSIPPQCVGPDSHFTSDLTACSSFTREVDGVVRNYRCVAGMVFNSILNTCDWPQNYPQCANPSVPQSFTPADPNVCLMPCPSDADAVYPMVTPTEIRCGEYYVCLNGTLYTGDCSDIGTGEFPVFDDNTKSCTTQREAININCPGTA